MAKAPVKSTSPLWPRELMGHFIAAGHTNQILPIVEAARDENNITGPGSASGIYIFAYGYGLNKGPLRLLNEHTVKLTYHSGGKDRTARGWVLADAADADKMFATLIGFGNISLCYVHMTYRK